MKVTLSPFGHNRAPISFKLFFSLCIEQRKLFPKPQHYFPVSLPSQLSHSFICHHHCPPVCSWWPPVLTYVWLRFIHPPAPSFPIEPCAQPWLNPPFSLSICWVHQVHEGRSTSAPCGRSTWSIVILSFIVQPAVMWPRIFDLMSEGASGYWDISPGHPALFLPKEYDPATGKSENFQLSPSPVKQSELHVRKVRCPLPTCFLFFSSLGTNPALISTSGHIRYCDTLGSHKHNVFFLFHRIFS